MSSMRGDDRQPDAMFSYVSAEQRVPQDHPLRAIRALVDDVLRDISREFDGDRHDQRFFSKLLNDRMLLIRRLTPSSRSLWLA